MTRPNNPLSERALILAPRGRDADLAASLLTEVGVPAVVCPDLPDLSVRLAEGAGLAVVAEEALRTADLGAVRRFVAEQPAWSDFPFLVLTGRGSGVERNPLAARLSEVLGNVGFLERPFHPTTLVSVVHTALRGRRRQYEARARLEDLRASQERLETALAAERRGVQHQRLLIDELNHRVKNTLATVQSIATQTLRNAGVDGEAYAALESRLLALSRAHDVLTRESWEGADLADVVAQAIAPYRGGADRFRTAGPPVRLNPRTALALAMAFQELATNAVKYGALSNATGVIRIDWGVHEPEPEPGPAAAARLRLAWREEGGPPVRAPSRRGFGSRLVERSLARDLDGTVDIAFAPGGVVCTVDAPLA